MTIFRESTQRKTIINFLKKREDHPSAAMIYESLKSILPNLSLGTVYRNLEILEKQGRIRCLSLAQKEARFDGQVLKHAHFFCQKCGNIEDIHLKKNCCQMTTFLESQEYVVDKFNLDIVGTCSTCNKIK